MKQLAGILQLIRPAQWVKNLIIFAAVLFSPAKVVLQNPDVIIAVIQGFFAFCLVSGGVYALNDLADLSADRHHPRKQNRPLPSGRVSVTAAILIGTLCAGGGVIWGFLTAASFGWILTAYLATNIIM